MIEHLGCQFPDPPTEGSRSSQTPQRTYFEWDHRCDLWIEIGGAERRFSHQQITHFSEAPL